MNFEFIIDEDGEKIITKYTGKDETVIIPKGVKSVEKNAFSNCYELKEIIFEEGIKHIGNFAFCSCENIEKIFLPQSLECIDGRWFFECKKIKCIEVDEDNKVYKSIDGNLYSKNGETLIQYAIGKEESVFQIPTGVKVISEEAFEDAMNLKAVIFPAGVEIIKNHAFAFCRNLITPIEFPNTLRRIECGAFWCCESLRSIYIPSSVEEIEENAFGGCCNIEIYCQLEENDNIIDDYYGIFGTWNDNNCIVWDYTREEFRKGNFKNNHLEDFDSDLWTELSIEDFDEALIKAKIESFYIVEKLLKKRIESDNEEIKKQSMLDLLISYFEGYYYIDKNMSEIYIDSNNQDLKMDKIIESSIIFAEYPDLINEEKELYYSGKLGLFRNILEKIYYEYKDAYEAEQYEEKLVRTILEYAEEKQKNIDAVFSGIETNLWEFHNTGELPFYLGYLPKGISYVPRFCFNQSYDEDCNNTELETIILPETIKSINNCAFEYCVNLKTITLSKNLENIGIEAFFCTNITEISIPDGVKEILDYTFGRCEELISINLPKELKKIGDYAFRGCSSLKSIVIPSTVSEMGENVFEYCTSLETIYCQAESKPGTWHENWLEDCDADVIWGYNE